MNDREREREKESERLGKREREREGVRGGGVPAPSSIHGLNILRGGGVLKWNIYIKHNYVITVCQ